MSHVDDVVSRLFYFCLLFDENGEISLATILSAEAFLCIISKSRKAIVVIIMHLSHSSKATNCGT